MKKDNTKNDPRSIPLCVDLDGTLFKTDVLVESFFLLLKTQPLTLLMTPFWILKGKSYFKQKISDLIDLEPDTFPYNKEFIEHLKKEHKRGKSLILATAANQKYARRAATHFKLFDNVLASDSDQNLQGSAKLRALESRYGRFGFDYAGNSRQDLAILALARKAIVVNPDMGVLNAVYKIASVVHAFDDRPNRLKSFLNAIRIRQWPKNLLLFVPLIISHQTEHIVLLKNTFLGFFSFCLCASSIYLINDLFDLQADRRHPLKCFRPFAAGDLPCVSRILLAFLLLIGAIILAFFLAPHFWGLLAGYCVFSLLYPMRLKQIAIIDVLVLSGLYSLRLIAGGVATSITISFWLLAFSMFIFFSLAILKRYTELLLLNDQEDLKIIAGRAYWATDLETLRVLGICSGFVSILVMALYINSDQVTKLYSNPSVLWMLCPLLLFWISRTWLSGRGQIHHDPVLFALQDRASQIIGVLILIFMVLAI